MVRDKHKRAEVFKHRMDRVLEDIKDEDQGGLWYQIVSYWRDVHKKSGYVLSDDNWVKSKVLAVKIVSEPGFDAERFKRCIVWAYSPERMRLKFWKDVTITTIGTVYKMYNQFLQSEVSKQHGENGSAVKGRRRFASYEPEAGD